MRKKRTRNNLKHRFFISFTGIIVLIIFLTFSIFTVYVYQSNRERYTGFLSNLTELSANQLDTLIQNMDNEALQIIANPTTLKAFNHANNDSSSDNYFDTNINLRNELISNLAAINGPNMYANRINVYNNQGDYVSIGVYQESREAVLAELSSANFKERYNNILALKGYSTVLPPGPDLWGGDLNRILFSTAREIRDVYRSYGIVEIQHEYASIDDIFTSYNRPDDIQVYILADKQLIYPYELDSKRLQTVIIDHYSSIIENNSNIIRTAHPIYKKDEFVAFSRLKNANWTVVYTQSANSLYQDFIVTAIISLVATLMIVGVSAILIYMISNRLTRPLRLLTKKINEINVTNPSVSIHKNDSTLYRDEFEELNQSFSDLFNKLEASKNEVIELRTSEMHAQILALQSQMNPHFLYNTLSVINASAIEEDYEKTNELCSMLSSMLRYSSSFEYEMVTLKEELKHANDYLILMKARFEDGLNYTINCDQELINLTVPKVILQPLIENSFNHGFKKKKPPWYIKIDILQVDDTWILEVTDNGTGFDVHRFHELNQKLTEYFNNPSASINNFKFGGLALLNILIRLKYIYKDKMIFEVKDFDSEGTTIRIGGLIYDKNHVNRR